MACASDGRGPDRREQGRHAPVPLLYVARPRVVTREGHVTFNACPGSGSYNKVPETGWLTNNRNLFLTVWEDLSSRWQRGHVPVRNLFRVACSPSFSRHLEWGKEGEGDPWGPLSQGHSSRSRKPHPPDLITSRRPRLLIPSHCGLGFQHVDLG